MFAAIVVLLASVWFGNCAAEKTICKIDENCTMNCASDDIIDLESSTDCKTIVVKLLKSNVDVWQKLKRYPIEKVVMFQQNDLQNIDDLFKETNIKKLYLYQNNLTELKTGTFDENKPFETLALNRNQIKLLETKSIPAVKTLYLHYNLIESLNADAFVNISHVKILRLDNNNIEKITAASLMGLKADYLDLSYNRIEYLEDASIPEVKHIKLDNNKLASIDSKKFVNISYTINLDLSYNRITQLSENSFSGMLNLTNLSLSNNLIASLDMYSIPTVKNLNLSYNLITFINTSMFEDIDYLMSLDINYNCIKSTDFHLINMNVSNQKDNETCKLNRKDTSKIKKFTSNLMIAIFLMLTLILVGIVTAIALRRYAESSTYNLKNDETTRGTSNGKTDDIKMVSID
ncbi:PREDICTED: insulin-like growth factor-binding protein complex acid labile subunit [Nicrophorus vespilloides]|uniref:Insulin-like growth factor-binding protein complex acid labile subunit n=1 Tax=Nicrophorus vespilloides TaxID=110193 RepID=A0ABM1N810_NICVS|nr:PREDICTED: insulin-like growth factor-binding protein complex acid labile subunit [Nicrophorus vespilloides]